MSATTKNQLQDTNNDYVYDSAGNLIQPGPVGGPYVFDAENRLISAGGMAYLYDGDGKRVGKAPANTPTQPNYLYWYGGGSDILQETNGAGTILYNDYYFNGMRVDRQESDNWVDHFFLDALGNVRCVYGDGDPDGGCSDYYPFGGERPYSNGGVNVPFKFTSKERDPESNLDNFGARFMGSNLGRFTSPDPLYIEAHRLGDPQRLNLYAYARNNPTNLTDPTGLDVAFKCDTQANCNKAVHDFNSRKGAQFKVALGKDGKLHVVKGSVADHLSKAEGALLGAVNDSKNHATINVSGDTGQFEFGVHNSAGVNSVDLGNLSKLDSPSNGGGINSGDALAHEALDAYYSLSKGAEAADWAAAALYPGLLEVTDNEPAWDKLRTNLLGSTFSQAISNGSGTERITFKYVTPIPAIDLFGKSPAARQEVFQNAGSRVTGVTFVPPPNQ